MNQEQTLNIDSVIESYGIRTEGNRIFACSEDDEYCVATVASKVDENGNACFVALDSHDGEIDGTRAETEDKAIALAIDLLAQKTIEIANSAVERARYEIATFDGITNEIDGQRIVSSFIGSIFTFSPSGKYYMPFACSNVTTLEAWADAVHRDVFNANLPDGYWVEGGEGDPCDLFLCRMETDEERDERRIAAWQEKFESGLGDMKHLGSGCQKGCSDCPDNQESEESGSITFSRNDCDLCGCPLAGGREVMHGYDKTGALVHLEVCEECLLYWANGDLPSAELLDWLDD